MKTKITTIVILLISIIIFSFKKDEKTAIQKIKNNYQQRIAEFKTEIAQIIQLLEKNNSDDKSLKQSYLKVRFGFKKVQYLLEYAEPILVKENINGAPLPKIENNSFGINVLNPKGLQLIDDLMYQDTLNRVLLITEFKYLQKILNDMGAQYFYDRDIFIASRIELIRIATMGVVGFDVPGSGNALKDVATSMQTMENDFLLYKNVFEKHNKLLSDSLFLMFKNANIYLENNQNFESFNRFYFTQAFINPLYKNLLKLHLALGYEMPNEISNNPKAVNYMSENIFDANFLNASYFLNIPQKFNTTENIALGKLLFFDPILSLNNERACASCHNPSKGFTDNIPKSIGYNFNGTVKRNSPTLLNCVYSDRYFHDLRAQGLTDQMEHVVTSKAEFNSDWLSILEKLKNSNEYLKLFNTTYGTEDLSIQQVQFSIAAYVGSLNGFNSTFDKLIKNANFEIKNKQNIIKGYNLFMGKAACGTCHFAPVFNGTVPPYYTESESEVLGVAENPDSKKQYLSEDKGRGTALLKEQVPFYEYSFKTPTVRNIELTFPYMHNGAYKDLNAVMTFYNNGGGEGVGIHLPYQTLATDKLNLSKKEIANIIAFMNALTDNQFKQDMPKFLPSFKDSIQWNNRKIGGVY